MFLILLMLANSSFAFELLTHDGHAHDEAVAELHGVGDAAMANHHGVQSQLEDSLAMDDDCVCDEICCESSVEFTSVLLATVLHDLLVVDPDRHNLYQSVSLELLLPPPAA